MAMGKQNKTMGYYGMRSASEDRIADSNINSLPRRRGAPGGLPEGFKVVVEQPTGDVYPTTREGMAAPSASVKGVSLSHCHLTTLRSMGDLDQTATKWPRRPEGVRTNTILIY